MEICFWVVIYHLQFIGSEDNIELFALFGNFMAFVQFSTLWLAVDQYVAHFNSHEVILLDPIDNFIR